MPPAPQSKNPRREPLNRKGQAINEAPVVVVDHLPGYQGENDDRDKLRQPHHPEFKGAVSQLIDLPPDRHCLDLERHRRHHPSAPKPPKCRMGK